MKHERKSDLFLLVDAGHDDVHICSYRAVRDDAAAESTSILDLTKHI